MLVGAECGKCRGEMQMIRETDNDRINLGIA